MIRQENCLCGCFRVREWQVGERFHLVACSLRVSMSSPSRTSPRLPVHVAKMSFDELLSKREDHPFIVQDKEFMMRATAPTGPPSVSDDNAPKILRILNLMELELREKTQKALAKSETCLSSPQALLPETPSTAHF